MKRALYLNLSMYLSFPLKPSIVLNKPKINTIFRKLSFDIRDIYGHFVQNTIYSLQNTICNQSPFQLLRVALRCESPLRNTLALLLLPTLRAVAVRISVLLFLTEKGSRNPLGRRFFSSSL